MYPAALLPLRRWVGRSATRPTSLASSTACGKTCKHENYELYLTRPCVHPAIEGLNSNFVGDLIIASQRPSTSLFLKHLLIDQFRSKHVTGVFNLQEKGEHAYCGPDGISEETGYSYNGMRDVGHFGVFYYEFPWPDMTAPENDVVLRSVQCMDHHITTHRSRVLVHCHAGLGRTGLMIACYFILAQRMPALEAVQLVRLCRPGAVQTKRQTEFCYGFEAHVFRLANAFTVQPSSQPAAPSPQQQQQRSTASSSTDPVTFDDFLKRQYDLLHGEEARTYRWVPRHVVDLLLRLVAFAYSEVLAVGRVPAIAATAAAAEAITKTTAALASMGGSSPAGGPAANVGVFSPSSFAPLMDDRATMPLATAALAAMAPTVTPDSALVDVVITELNHGHPLVPTLDDTHQWDQQTVNPCGTPTPRTVVTVSSKSSSTPTPSGTGGADPRDAAIASPTAATLGPQPRLLRLARRQISPMDQVIVSMHVLMRWFRWLDTPFLGPEHVKSLVRAVTELPSSTTAGCPVCAAVDALPRGVRHTGGVVLSAVHILSECARLMRHPNHEEDLSYAMKCVAEAFTIAGMPGQMYRFGQQHLTPNDRFHLTNALNVWRTRVGSIYFDPLAIPTGRRMVARLNEDINRKLRALVGIPIAITLPGARPRSAAAATADANERKRSPLKSSTADSVHLPGSVADAGGGGDVPFRKSPPLPRASSDATRQQTRVAGSGGGPTSVVGLGSGVGGRGRYGHDANESSSSEGRHSRRSSSSSDGSPDVAAAGATISTPLFGAGDPAAEDGPTFAQRLGGGTVHSAQAQRPVQHAAGTGAGQNQSLTNTAVDDDDDEPLRD